MLNDRQLYPVMQTTTTLSLSLSLSLSMFDLSRPIYENSLEKVQSIHTLYQHHDMYCHITQP